MMPEAEIIETFGEHERLLTKKFKSFAKIPDFRINMAKNEFDYLLILDGLVSPEQQREMYQKLRATFCKSNTDSDITSDVSTSFVLRFAYVHLQIRLIHFVLLYLARESSVAGNDSRMGFGHFHGPTLFNSRRSHESFEATG